MEPTYTYKRFGYQVMVYANRIVILDKPNILPAKETDIPIKNITSMDVDRMNQAPTLKMNDGKMFKIKMFGKDARAFKDAVMALL